VRPAKTLAKAATQASRVIVGGCPLARFAWRSDMSYVNIASRNAILLRPGGWRPRQT
jgi:hypothetical protein